ncbi:MAG TPA: dihydrofolate reductase family protein [Solirubrobacteraceae bacterium]|nr:dihydrofolate reductase family protein [Solirubrobacteraceae bacterium]
MSAGEDASEPRPQPAGEPAAFTRLLPAGETADASQIVDGFELGKRAQTVAARPYLILNMVSTLDGRASIGGRSGPIGNRADRELFHALRAGVDAVMAGAGTVRVERYGRIIPNVATRERRVERGLEQEPLACIVSARLSLPDDLPLLNEPAARVAIITPSAAALTGVSAQIEYVRASSDGRLDLRLAMRELSERFGVRTLLCEGGPHLNAELLQAGVVDELFLSLAPTLSGGEDVTGEALRIVAGATFERPLELELLGALENESHLFLRYGVRRSA